MVSTPDLHCPICHVSIPLIQAFDNATTAHSTRNWIVFTCPNCNSTDVFFSLIVDRNHSAAAQVTIGTIDGIPGPVLVGNEAISVPNLTVHTTDAALTIDYDTHHWIVPIGAGTVIFYNKVGETPQAVIYDFSINNILAGQITYLKENLTVTLSETYDKRLVESYYAVACQRLLTQTTFPSHLTWTE